MRIPSVFVMLTLACCVAAVGVTVPMATVPAKAADVCGLDPGSLKRRTERSDARLTTLHPKLETLGN